jgi:biotin synthase
MACKAVALARLLRPNANIPSTTALAVSDPAAGRSDGLMRGANVVMPNLTPPRYRHLYEIYPGKATPAEAGEQLTRLRRQLAALERSISSGRGDSPAYRARQEAGAPRKDA